jgi:hypothetical protein
MGWVMATLRVGAGDEAWKTLGIVAASKKASATVKGVVVW